MENNKVYSFEEKKYDSDLLYGKFKGKTVEELFTMAQDALNNQKAAGAYRSVPEDYNFDSSKLKDFENENDISHKELTLPWEEETKKKYIFKLTYNDFEMAKGWIPYYDPLVSSALVKGILIGACDYDDESLGYDVEYLGDSFLFFTETTPERFDRFKKAFEKLFNFELKYTEEEVKQ